MSRPPTAGSLNRVGASPGATSFIQKGRINAIPARIRAFVKVVHDLDRDQFPEVFTSLNNNSNNNNNGISSQQSSLVVYGADSSAAPHRGNQAAATAGGTIQLNETAVHALSVALGREVKTQQDWEDFAVALEEYSRHLSSVDMASLERSGLGQLVTLSASIDREASSAGLSMARELSAVYACHQTILKIVQTDYILYSTHPVVFELFIHKMTELLQDLEQTVVGIARRRESRRRQQMQHARTVSPLSTSKATEGVGDNELTEKEASFRLVELNSTLEYHIAHLTWFMSVTTDETSTDNGLPTKGEIGSAAAARRKGSSSGTDDSPLSATLSATKRHATSGSTSASLLFDARDFINDVSAAEIWCHHVGRYSPACSVEEFMPALASFSEWAHEPILKIMDFRTCGIVSAVGMIRVLSLWGPYLLLDRNLSRDLSRGFINLSYTTEMAEAHLRQQIAEKPPPPPADAWTSPASLASKPQRFGIPAGTCVMTLSTDKNCAFDLLLVTSKGNIKRLLVDREGGTWILQGVSQEDYENPTDACVSFPHIFSNPAGEKFYKVPETTSREAATSEAYSILHRACFRNNVPYVAKLLDRGNGVIANNAVVDPSITSALSWTPLLAAVNNPNGDPFLICRMLLDSGADVSYSDASTCTALYYAIVNRYVRAAKVLVEHYVAETKREASVVGGGLRLSESSTAGTVDLPLSSTMFLPTTQAQLACLSPLALRCGIPAPTTSAVTVPLFVGLGAHFYNASDVDNLRLEHSLPDLEIIRMLLRVTNDLCITRAAYEILFHKLNTRPMRHREHTLYKKGGHSSGRGESENDMGTEYGTARIREWTRRYGGDVSWGNTNSPDLGEGRGAEWNFGNFPCPTLTDDEAAREVKAVANHTLLCQANDTACRKVLQAIGDHCFLLSARRLVAQVRNQ